MYAPSAKLHFTLNMIWLAIFNLAGVVESDTHIHKQQYTRVTVVIVGVCTVLGMQPNFRLHGIYLPKLHPIKVPYVSCA